MPVENEDECRKRKAMQSLRRMEAKRKRTEKQRNSRSLNCQNGRVYSEGRPDKDRKLLEGYTDHEKDRLLTGSGDISSEKEATFGISNRGYDGKNDDCKGENDNNDLVASQGSGTSGLSAYETLSVKGMTNFSLVVEFGSFCPYLFEGQQCLWWPCL